MPKVRASPAIPDHEVLRKIGGGAYGEVWLARGVTGALRAVKLVWREDFEDDRTFEREFDGILKFEPISRDHPGLVNILHVGRSTGDESFYYYVMELGDDVETGRDINPIEYAALTLRADHHEGLAEQWPVGDCVDIGLRLAEALQHLHENGLAHRDVKPSNVIFVNGKAKLADIGLVAARGQRTFVGTEGFVPPEGPGSAKADIYSLGKVLYEITTGMDRMNFPELPESMPGGRDRKLWLELNRIICEVCEPRISKRKIATAAQLANSLRRLKRGKRRRPHGISLAITSLFLVTVTSWGGWEMVKDSDWVKNLITNPVTQVGNEGLYRIISTPEGADVVNQFGDVIGTTPTQVMSGMVGDEIRVTLRKDGYRPLKLVEIIKMSSRDEPMILIGEMGVFSPPQIGVPWEDQHDQLYLPDGEGHLSSDYVSKDLWDMAAKHIRANGKHVDFLKTSENGQPVEIVLTTQEIVDRFSLWMRDQGIEAGFLTDEHEVSGVLDSSYANAEMSDKARGQKLRPFRIRVDRLIYGRLSVTSEPPGAELFVNGVSEGMTHGEMVVSGIRPGRIKIELVLEGYKPLNKSYDLKSGELLQLQLVLQKNQGVIFGKPWENGLGMKFVPLDTDLMACIWETRVKDYKTWLRETKQPEAKSAPFEQTDMHPVVNVSREKAQAFCEWLTKRELSKERISQNHVYRLPSDLEWSLMVGLNDEDVDVSPGTRDARKKEVFPWGETWAEANVPGNFSDMTAALSPDVDVDRTIAGYDDGFVHTAPVGSYDPNDLGIYDLSGNVQEWVGDSYSKHAQGQLGVLRGGGWNTYQKENLHSGARNAVPINFSDSMYGFRVILARKPIEPSADQSILREP